MRRIGTLTDPDQAQRFSDYLTTLSIESSIDRETHTDPQQGTHHICHVWIRDEGDVGQAKQELDAFLAAPGDAKYSVGQDAQRIRKEKKAIEKRKRSVQQRVQPRPATAGPLMGVPVKQQSIPVVIGVIAFSILASFSTNFGRPSRAQVPGELSSEETIFFALSFVDARDYFQTEDPFASIKKGEIWRVITPIFLHGNTYHLAFNMLGLFFLGSAIERLHGSPFMLFLLLVSGIFGGLVQVLLPPEDQLPEFLAGLAGSPFSIGASGAVYGLFGYLWIRPLVTPTYAIRMAPANVAILLGWLFYCIFFVERIANGAHLGGLLAGVVIAALMAKNPAGTIT